MSDTKLNEAISITTSPERLTELVDTSIELARAVATNPSTPSDLLQKLSKYDDLETRRNVTLNPNTSTDILFKLAQYFPEEFLNNPILGLLLLENPNLLQTIPADTFLELLKVGNVPQMFIEWALQAPSNHNSTNYRLAIALDPSITKEVLLKLYKQLPKTDIGQAVLLHVNWNGEISSFWDEAAFIEIRTCGYIRRNKSVEKLLDKFGIIPKHLRPYSDAYRLVVSLHKHPITNHKYSDLINRVPFFSSVVYRIRYFLNRRNQIISPVIFFKFLILFLITPYWVTIITLNFILTHRIVLLLISTILFFLILSIIIFSLQILLKLILISILSLIVLSWMGAIVSLLCLIIFTCINIGLIGIIMLIEYSFNKIYDLAKDLNKKTPKPKKICKYSSNIFKQDLKTAKNLNTSSIRLLELASSRWLYIREVVAANPNTSAEVLKKLAQDDARSLHVIIAKHLNTPAEVLIEFSQTKCGYTKIAVVKNIKTPLSALKHLALSSKNYDMVSLEAVKAIEKRYPEELTNVLVEYVEKTRLPSAARLFLLLHKTAPSDFLARHYRSLDWRERYAVAQNPNTPINILEKLKLDANSIVRATAKARF